MTSRIGVFGGTFDPIHLGHLLLASESFHALDLTRVIFVPARRPPHKTDQEISDDRHRLAMVRLAVQDDPRFDVSLIELNRTGPSYTADTLEQLARHHSDTTLFFLMGEDSLRDLPTWHDPERIVEHAMLGVATRPGVDVDLSSITEVMPTAIGRIVLVPSPEIEISSSDIRRRLQEGCPITYHVPPTVERYIIEQRLYRENDE